MAYIHGQQPAGTLTDQVAAAMTPAQRKRFKGELKLLAADATVGLLGQMGMSRAEITKAAKTGSLKSLRKGRVTSKKKKRGKGRKRRYPAAVPPRAAVKSARVSAKAYTGNVVPIGRGTGVRKCWNGHPDGKPGYKHCTDCGEAYGISYSEHTEREVTKARQALRAPKTHQQLMAEIHDSHDPQVREGIWAEIRKGNGGQAS